jgi:hypothetical protein
VHLRLTRLDLDALAHAAAGASAALQLPQQLRLRTAAGLCGVEPDSLRELDAPMGDARYTWRVRCSGVPTAVESDLLFDVVPAHLHFARFTPAAGEPVELLLTEDRRAASLPPGPLPGPSGPANRTRPAAPARAATLGRYFRIGVHHIASGWDHLAFLFALVLLARSFAAVAIAATGFTLGHSVTLGLAALGVVRPDPAAVEALVALSIVLLAMENVWLVSAARDFRLPLLAVAALLLLAGAARWLHHPAHVGAPALLGLALFSGCHYAQLAAAPRPLSSRRRAAVAGLFGLVHGFAFAAVLQAAALPTGALVTALCGFNLGVEAGQLLLLAAAVLLFRLAGGGRLGAPARRQLVQLGSAVAAGFGMYWAVLRGM